MRVNQMTPCPDKVGPQLVVQSAHTLSLDGLALPVKDHVRLNSALMLLDKQAMAVARSAFLWLWRVTKYCVWAYDMVSQDL